MKAQRLYASGERLRLDSIAVPEPEQRQLLLRVTACGVCRTDLHIVDGEIPGARYPITPGHEIVGRVIGRGSSAERFPIGARVGVPWLGWTCGRCRFCAAGRENLCEAARFTGFQIPGGYAECVVADERFCLPIPSHYGDAEAAPLLCAGLIGYRAYARAGNARRIGIYGFGAAAHILAQVASFEGRSVFAFTRPGDAVGQAFARQCGACWAGDSTQAPPEPLDAAILFAPVGALVPIALRAIEPGGAVICAGIHMSEIPSFEYALLWRERRVESIANLTRADGERFMAIAEEAPLRTQVHVRDLENANEALSDLRNGVVSGALVLRP
jgi:alcohol dehydrogenase, propanol-preferring